MDLMEAKWLYEEMGLSIPQLADRFALPRSTMRHRLIEVGTRLRTSAEGMRKAKRDGRGVHFGPRAGWSQASKDKLRASMLARGEATAKGVSLKDGYYVITRGKNKGKAVHRVIMEAILGRPLHWNEVVHHRDHDRSNNDPRNLEVMTISEHQRLHAMERIAAGEKLERHFCKEKHNGLSK